MTIRNRITLFSCCWIISIEIDLQQKLLAVGIQIQLDPTMHQLLVLWVSPTPYSSDKIQPS